MAQRASVNLSDLPEGDHLVKDSSNQGTCVVYMKLTEACVKAIDALLAAKKVECMKHMCESTLWCVFLNISNTT